MHAAKFAEIEESVGVEWTRQATLDMSARRDEEYKNGKNGEEEGGIVDIAVVGDGGWGKRSLGHSYDALTGIFHI